MVEEAQEHLDHEQRIRRLEQDFKSLFFGDTWMQLQSRIAELENLEARHRMVLAESLLETRLLKIVAFPIPLSGSTDHLRARLVSNDLVRHKEWFTGAIAEAAEPQAILEQWWSKTKTSLEQHGFQVLAEEVQGMPFPPSTP